jgi:flagellar biosynthesis/type III secretory pathway M-ring protein FliF/YscJ
MATYLLYAALFVVGFVLAWFIKTAAMAKIKKELRSAEGLLESERLKKENAQKENQFLIQSGDTALLQTKERLKMAQDQVKQMDEDIILLQRSNEETEALLAKGEPAIDELKKRLIEANNAIARLKAQLQEK